MWLCGFLIIGIAAAGFINSIFADAHLKNIPERWIIDIVGLIGTTVVSTYWALKWYKFRERLRKFFYDDRK